MKFKFSVPYVLAGISLFSAPIDAGTPHQTTQTNQQSSASQKNIEIYDDTDFDFVDNAYFSAMFEYDFTQMMLDIKANDLCEKYADNMLAAQKKLYPLLGKRGYRAAVRRELPGAPAGKHCVYGQYVQLNRAVRAMGDTIEIIPTDASRSCKNFISTMRQCYQNTPGCIYEGRMHATDSAYNAELEKFLARRVANGDTARVANTKKFAKRNFSAQHLNTGTIAVVPRRRGSSAKHMVMIAGRGHVKDGQFTPDPKGEIIYVGHNRETMGNMERAYDTSNVFVVNTKEIARQKYEQELKSVQEKTNAELIKFLGISGAAVKRYERMPRKTLLQMARNKYFKNLVGDETTMHNMGRVR